MRCSSYNEVIDVLGHASQMGICIMGIKVLTSINIALIVLSTLKRFQTINASILNTLLLT